MQSFNRPSLDDLSNALVDVAPHISTLPASERASLLKSTVCAAVDDLKALGLSSARVEAVVLSLVNDVWRTSADQESVADIRTWCIQRYFEPRGTVG